MKLRQKEQACKFFDLRVKKYFKYQTPLVLLFVALFIFLNRNATAAVEVKKGDIIISELMWAGSSLSIADEFIELFNTTDHAIDIGGWNLSKISDDEEDLMLMIPIGKSIAANSYFLVANYNENYIKSILNIKPDIVNTAVSLANDKLQIVLYRGSFLDKENLIDVAGNGKTPLSGENEPIKKSMERNELIEDGKLKASWHACASQVNLDMEATDYATPGVKNSKTEEAEEDEDDEIIDTPKIYSDKIIINEIFPAPLKNSGLEEFVELYSSSDKVENLDGWYLKDRAGKNCALTGNIIDPAISRFLTLKNDTDKKCTLALNDTQGEFLGLYNPTDAAAVFSVGYEGSAKKGRSYNFNGSSWSWSQFLTEGKKNVFNSQPYGKIKIDDDVFENVYADFSVSTGDGDGDKIKISWDFGDGHKSSLAKTRHKYEKTGMYNGSVKLSDGSEDVLQNFMVEVKKFPHPEIKIIAINANPAGADTGVEYITVQNKSKNKINLNGWSIATGWKKFINHPIREDVIIKKDKSKEITNIVSSFTLNNTKSKIQLRYPDGKVAHEVKYKSPNKSIVDGEVYQKVKGGWEWKQEISNDKLQISNKNDKNKKQEDLNILSSVIGNQPSIVENAEEINNQEKILGTEIEKLKVVAENNLLKINNDKVKIELLKTVPRVLGTETVREIDGIYFFTPQIPEREHYAMVFLKNIFSSLNLQLNNLLNLFYHSIS